MKLGVWPPLKLGRWIIVRRLVQLGTLAFFAWAAIASATDVLRGTLSSSVFLDVVPLTDPLAALQMWLAGHLVGATALVGVGVVVAFYALIGGRAFCGWICPVNVVTDTAAWLNQRYKLRSLVRLPKGSRYGALALALVVSAAMGVAAWEAVSPIGLLQRAVVYGLSAGWWAVVGVFVFDLLVAQRGFCGHLCPTGAAYALLGARPALRVRFDAERCTDCMECHKICPERDVLRPILPQARRGDEGDARAAWIDAGACLNCGRCIDVCGDGALGFGLRPPLSSPSRS